MVTTAADITDLLTSATFASAAGPVNTAPFTPETITATTSHSASAYVNLLADPRVAAVEFIPNGIASSSSPLPADITDLIEITQTATAVTFVAKSLQITASTSIVQSIKIKVTDVFGGIAVAEVDITINN